MAVGGTHLAPLASSWLVAILHPVYGILEPPLTLLIRTFISDRDNDKRLTADFTAELDVLIGSEAVLVIVKPLPVW